MSVALLLAMASFALAASISPGPVNALALASGVHHGFRRSIAFVTGATVGFAALLLVAGLGLAEALVRAPALADASRVAGIAFLLHMAWRLWRASGRVSAGTAASPPSLLAGATLQWLNPKAWIAAMAGMGAFASGGGAVLVWSFVALYFVICYGSIALWAYAGARLAELLADPRRMRLFNRAMAVLLALGAAGMAAGP
ncbi:LysE family translocator [Arenibaculum pallidiluteum]|uniref:LysE family translocator n=1 Tax=Arenibaculum pallidiluteum TaxID=2812559 RepID=UPI001A974FB1|nr:LysE family translocator [Arenibaculum pallidiluteum]